jgi:hypothetical protein
VAYFTTEYTLQTDSAAVRPMNDLLVLVVALLATILITLLGWWPVIGVIALIGVAIVIIAAALRGIVALIAPSSGAEEPAAQGREEREHRRLIDALPPLKSRQLVQDMPTVAGDNEMMLMLRDVAVWEWMRRGRPGALEAYVDDYIERTVAKASSRSRG